MALTEEQKQKSREEYRAKIKRKDKIIWIIFGAAVFLFISGKFLWGVIGVNIPYSEGERSAIVIKVSDKGLIWKTFEGEAVLSQKGFAVTYVWNFSIDGSDPNKQKLLQELRTAFETGQTVKIKYRQMAGAVPWRGKTSYFIKEIRFE